MTVSDFASARVVLLGTGTHAPGSMFPDVASVAGTVHDLRTALIEQCGVDPARVDVVLDAVNPMDMGDAIARAATDPGDLLLVYYVGHGLLDGSARLCLACQATVDVETARHRTLPYTTVRDYLLDYLRSARNRSVVLILDCCFSGTAVEALGDSDNLTAISGAFVLTSAGRDELALAPPGQRHTAFTGALLRLISDGDPGLPPHITLQDAVRHLSRVLPAAGFPRPRQRADVLAAQRVLVANRQRATVTVEEPVRAEVARERQPYRGLSYFDTEDSPWFFGRETTVASLVTRLRQCYDEPRPLFVIGASGAGKSSLLRAGLIPAVGQGELGLPHSSRWPRLEPITPGVDPFGALAAALVGLVALGIEEVDERLRRSPTELADMLAGVVEPGERVLLIVDQFEELFDLCPDEGVRASFVTTLTTAAGGDSPRALMVLGMRADRFAHSIRYPELAAPLQDHFIVNAMGRDNIRAAIEKPAHLAGLAVEPELIDLILSDLGERPTTSATEPSYEPGRLPLLAHALRSTWLGGANSAVLTVADYHRTGRISGALARTATEALAKVDLQYLQGARAVLIRLVAVSETGEDTRRRPTLDELRADVPEAEAVDEVLRVFGDPQHRLLTIDQDTVWITHEVLISAWQVLRDWLNADRDNTVAVHQINQAAHQWSTDGEDTHQLYRGDRLTRVEHLMDADQSANHHLTPAARQFLAAGIDERDRIATAATKRRKRIRVMVFSAFALVMVMLASVALVAVQQIKRADKESLIAATKDLIADSDATRAQDGQKRIRQTISANTLAGIAGDADTARDARKALVTALSKTQFLGMLSTSDASGGLEAGRDWLLTASKDRSLAVWNLRDHRTFAFPNTGSAFATGVFVPGKDLLILVREDGTLQVWSLSQGAAPVMIGNQASSSKVAPTAVLVNPQGDRAFTGAKDGSVSAWDISKPDAPREIGTADNPDTKMRSGDVPIRLLTLSADGQRLDSVSYGESQTAVTTTARIYSLGSPSVSSWTVSPDEPPQWRYRGDFPDLDSVVAPPEDNDLPRVLPIYVRQFAVATSPDQSTFVVGGRVNLDAAALLGSFNDTDVLVPLSGHRLAVTQALYSHTGRLLVTVDAENVARLWELSRPHRPQLLIEFPTGGHPIVAESFKEDDSVLYLAHDDGSVSSWATEPLVDRIAHPIQDGKELVIVEPLPGGTVVPFEDRRGTRDINPVHAVDHRSRFIISSKNPREVGVGDNAVRYDSGDAEFTVSKVGTDGTTALVGRGSNLHLVTAMAVNEDRSLLAIGTWVGRVELWSLSQPDKPTRLAAVEAKDLDFDNDSILSIAVAPNSRTIAVTTDKGRARLLDVSDSGTLTASGLLKRDDQAEENNQAMRVLSLSFAPDSKILVTGDNAGRVIVWDVTDRSTPRTVASSTRSDNPILSIAHSKHDHLMAVGTANYVTLWDTTEQTPQFLQSMSAPGLGAQTLIFDDTSHHLATTDGHSNLTYWDTTRASNLVNDPLKTACAIMEGGITQEDWPNELDQSKISYHPSC